MESERILQHHIPSRFFKLADGSVAVRWISVNGIDYTDPFFEETIQRALSLQENSSGGKLVTTPGELIRIAEQMPESFPDAFIFHLSRCGSTLLSQMLCQDEDNTILAEVPILDQVLNAEHYGFHLPEYNKRKYFESIIRILAHCNDNYSNRLIVKADSWHILHYAVLREWYPEIPFFLLYRNPVEIINSHSKLPGMHAVRGSGIAEIPNTGEADHFSYLSAVLTEYYNRYRTIAADDAKAIFIGYERGPECMLKILTDSVYVNCESAKFNHMLQRSRYHSKKKDSEYVSDSESKLKLMLLAETSEAYNELRNVIDIKTAVHE
ncbi:MAG: hypothetical protein L6Q81_09515 [Bacteroidia bacterium]|nr:hypothetical protein [Bacteroidia bacterium]